MKSMADIRTEFNEVLTVSKRFLVSLNEFKNSAEYREEIAYQRGYKNGFNAGQNYERSTHKLSAIDSLVSYWNSFRKGFGNS